MEKAAERAELQPWPVLELVVLVEQVEALELLVLAVGQLLVAVVVAVECLMAQLLARLVQTLPV